MCFIKKIFEGKVDDSTHRQFVRFGKGDFEGRAAANFRKNGGKVKIGASYEYANDIVEITSKLKNIKFSGIVLSKEQLPFEGRKKGELNAYNFNGNSQDILKILDKTYFVLVDAEDDEIKLKMEKNLPKPSKSGEAKIDIKFCQLEISEKYWPAVKDCLFWDFPDIKKGSVSHCYMITEIVAPKNEKDFEKMRVLAKRKGKIFRKIEADKLIIKEKEMVV